MISSSHVSWHHYICRYPFLSTVALTGPRGWCETSFWRPLPRWLTAADCLCQWWLKCEAGRELAVSEPDFKCVCTFAVRILHWGASMGLWDSVLFSLFHKQINIMAFGKTSVFCGACLTALERSSKVSRIVYIPRICCAVIPQQGGPFWSCVPITSGPRHICWHLHSKPKPWVSLTPLDHPWFPSSVLSGSQKWPTMVHIHPLGPKVHNPEALPGVPMRCSHSGILS